MELFRLLILQSTLCNKFSVFFNLYIQSQLFFLIYSLFLKLDLDRTVYKSGRGQLSHLFLINYISAFIQRVLLLARV